MKFDTKYRKSVRFNCKSGDGTAVEYAYEIKDGIKKLIPIGKKDVQAEIDSYRESCDINVIVARFMAGDENALNQVQGFYADMKSMPKTYAEWFERYQECENMFNKLPVDVREKFNHSVTEFWSEFGSEHWLDALTINTPSAPDESEVKEDAES